MRTITRLATLVLITLCLLPAEALATFPGADGPIAFGKFDAALGDHNLYTANPDGTDVSQLTHVTSFFSDWSPDGRRLAFDYIDADGNVQLATINRDGSDFHPITSGTGISEVPSWSPDGGSIAFDYSPEANPDAPGFHTSIYIMDAAGTNPRPLLANASTFDVEPKISPDGARVAFVRIRKYNRGLQQEAVFVVDIDGTDERQLTSWGLAAEHPTWSPDGRWITFNDASGKQVDYNPHADKLVSGSNESIYLIRPDGSDQHVIYQGTTNTGGVKPIFSPSGSRILFACVDYKHRFFGLDLCVMRLDGSDVVDITNTPDVFENFPSWGPSSS
jgi:Tol biopolymer transport system component